MDTLGFPTEFRVEVDGEVFRVKISPVSDGTETAGTAIGADKGKPAQAVTKEVPPGAVPASMAGLILSLEVEVGDKVNAGDLVATIEMMKMRRHVNSPHGGTVKEILVEEGDVVTPSDILMVVQ